MAKATKTPSTSPAAELVDDAPSFTVSARLFDPNASLTDCCAAIFEFSADARRLSQAIARYVADAKDPQTHSFLHRSHALISEAFHGLQNIAVDIRHLPPRP